MIKMINIFTLISLVFSLGIAPFDDRNSYAAFIWAVMFWSIPWVVIFAGRVKK